MSLLLNALQEAENRRLRATGDPAPRAAATPADPPTLLALEDDVAPLRPESANLADPEPSPRPATRATAEPRPRAGRRTPVASTRRSPLLYVAGGLVATLIVAAAAYYYFLAPAPLRMTPPLSDSYPSVTAPLTPAASTAAAPVETPPSVVIASVIRPADEPRTPVAAAPRTREPVAEPVSVPAPAARNSLVVTQRASSLPDAHAALRAGDLALAEKLYRDTLTGDADQVDAHVGLALIAQSRGNDAEALRHYRAVIAVSPQLPQAWAGLADLVGDGELPAMESRLRDLLATHPDPALHFALGNLLSRQSRWADAQQSYFAASSAAPQNADYAFNVAVALDRMGKGTAAAGHYARALTLAGDSRSVQFDLKAARQRQAELQGTPP